MSFTVIRPIPSPEEIKNELPLNSSLSQLKIERELSVKNVLKGKDERLVIVIGPCSAHDENAVIDYVSRLGKVQEKIKEHCIIVPRIYTNKPRTTGHGYKGMAHQPDHRKDPNIAEGIRMIRKMHIRCMEESNLCAADEMLYPTNHPYLDDILCYVAVGARSVENQQHRLTASGIDIPVGMKNPTSGDLKVALNSVFAAQSSHIFGYNGQEVQTNGNPYAHLIVRGAIDHYGQIIPNYHYEDLMDAASEYQKRNLKNPAIFVDTNHDNSGKKYDEQPRIATEVLQSRKYSPILHAMIKGLIIESYLEDGAQKPDENVYGKSITDPCLGWDKTEKLLFTIADLA